VWEVAKRYNRTPWEIKQMPAGEFYELLDMMRLEAFASG